MRDNESLSDLAAEEIRAHIGRRNMNKSELARKLGVSHTWVTNRLAGHQQISLDELQQIAEALGVPVGDLLPRRLTERVRVTTAEYPPVPEQPMPDAGRRTHPIGRPLLPHSADAMTRVANRTIETKPFVALPAKV
jgi:transcriptional regulator with XRE-family HTH domain